LNYQKDKKEFDAIKARRSNWNQMYQVLGEFVHQMKQNFQGQPANGEFLTKEIYDASGAFAASNSASALLGMLWPGSASQAFELAAPDGIDLTTELAEFYERMNTKTHRAFDDPKANLSLALDEYMLDQMVFGTSGVGVDKGTESKLLFKPYGVQEMFVCNGANGKVSRAYLLFEWEVERVVQEYGEANVSEKTLKMLKDGKLQEKVCILHIIRPRKEIKAMRGRLAMPFEGLHLEYSGCHLLREDGYNEFPIPVGRFRRLNYEEYGRSPAMNALPDIREANILREAVIIATEKQLDPPLGVLDDGMLGGNVIDTSPAAINVFNASASMGSNNPVFPLVTVGDLNTAIARLESLKETIAQHFFIDRLLDFNNDTQMTFGEAQIRDQRTNASMAAIYNRQIGEVFTPVIERGVAILFRGGEFGVVRDSEEEAELLVQGIEPNYIPDALADLLERGEDIYKIVYKTKAANAAKAEEYIAIADITNFTLQAMQVDQSLKHRLDLHESIKQLGTIRGLPVGILRQDDKVQELIQADAEQMQQMQALQSGEQIANIADKAASAEQRMENV
jgi:hypothetical protein